MASPHKILDEILKQVSHIHENGWINQRASKEIAEAKAKILDHFITKTEALEAMDWAVGYPLEYCYCDSGYPDFIQTKECGSDESVDAVNENIALRRKYIQEQKKEWGIDE